MDKIKVVKKKIEDCVLDVDLPKVDIIISEWMGFCLLFESMLDSVIHARDTFLKKDGLMFPERARVYLAAGDDLEYKVRNDAVWTDNKYNIDFSLLRDEWEQFMIVDKINC